MDSSNAFPVYKNIEYSLTIVRISRTLICSVYPISFGFGRLSLADSVIKLLRSSVPAISIGLRYF